MSISKNFVKEFSAVFSIPIIGIIVGFTLSACNGKVNEKHIAKVDSLSVVLDEISKGFAGIDTATVYEYNRIATDNLSFIQKNYKDTMGRELAIFLSDYRTANKVFGHITTNYTEKLDEIAYSQNQLADLMLDLKNDLVPQEQIETIFKSESKAINTLQVSLSSLISRCSSQLEKFREMNPKVEEIVNGIKQKQEQSVTE